MIDELRDSLTYVDVPERPPLATILDRGRAQRRRQRGRIASLGVAVVAAGCAVALGVHGVRGTASRSTSPKPGAGSRPRTIRTAGFTLVSYRSGKVKLSLTHAQVFDPPELRHALARDGVPALVKSGTYCFSTPAAPDPNSIGVMAVRPFDGRLSGPTGFSPARALLKKAYAQGPPQRPDLQELINHTVTVINPAKIPAGTELFFEYAADRHLLYVSLIRTSSHTCRTGQPPAE